MANYEATRYDFDGASLTDIQGLNTGLIIPWTTASVPTGFLECDGSNVSRSTYATLFAVIGTTYGAGDGASTFGLPDFSDNCCVSKSPNKALASTGGANAVTTTGNMGGSAANHSLSSPEIPSHQHTVNYSQTTRGTQNPFYDQYPPTNFTSGNEGSGSGHDHPLSATFSGGSDSVLQPYLTMIYIIKT